MGLALRSVRYDNGKGGGIDVAFVVYMHGVYFTAVTACRDSGSSVDVAAGIVRRIAEAAGVDPADHLFYDVQTHRGGYPGGPGWFEIDLVHLSRSDGGWMVETWEVFGGHALVDDVDERGCPLKGWAGGYPLVGIPPDVFTLFKELIA